MFWPIHAGCSDMPPQPELSNTDQTDQPTSNLKYNSPLHKKYGHTQYDLRSYNSQVNTMHRRIERRPIRHSRLSLKFTNPSHWKGCFSPRVLRQRKCAYFESCRPRRANDNMTNYRLRFGDSGVRVSPSADEYEPLGTSFTNLFGTRGSPSTFEALMETFAEQNSRPQDARANPVTTIHSWSQQHSSLPTPSEIAASPTPPSFIHKLPRKNEVSQPSLRDSGPC